jgi:hypothetical protein
MSSPDLSAQHGDTPVAGQDQGRKRVVRNREEAFERFSSIIEGPMMVLALAMILLIIVPLVVDLTPDVDRRFVAVDYLVWAASPSSTGSSCT